MTSQETGAGEYIYKGIKRIAGFAPVKLTGWSVGVAQHREEIMVLAYANRNLAMFVGIIFLIMTITAVFYFSGAVSVPVQKTLDTLNKAIEQASEAVIIIGLDRKIQFVNPAMARIIDKPINDLVGRIPELSNTDMEGSEEVWKVLEQGRVWSGSISGTRKDSSGYTMDLTVTPVWETSGNISCFLAVGKDVTRELSMEAQLRQSQKMEAIGTLAGGIAHDFNNILSAVFGYSELAQRSLSDREKACLYLDEILKAAGRARDLVKHIMTFSRQAEQQKKKFQPKYVIREALKLLRASLPSTIEINEAVKSDSFIIADTTQIHQVVMNLCTNAGYAMKDHGGILKVALEDYKADQEFAERQGIKRGDYIMLQVSDTGKGIPPEIVDRIFDPFYTTKPHGEGTGLGLSVVHGIVKSLGGTITVASKTGKGTAFTIYLPAERCDIKDTDENALADIPGGSERLILVDDEESLMLAEKGILEDFGYHISGFTKSEQALEAFMNDPMSFDTVITDYTMPRMTGYELALRIREIRKDIPVIICTGYIDSEVEARIKLAGINEFVRKPVTRREFGMALRRVLDNKGA